MILTGSSKRERPFGNDVAYFFDQLKYYSIFSAAL